MDKYFTFNPLDKKLWLGIAAVSGIMIAIFSIFTTNSPFYFIERFVITLFEMFLPGYVIMKLFLDKFELTDYKTIDKFLVSFGLSICTVQTLYFLATYLRTYAFNVDEDVISSNAIAIFLSLLVIGVAFGVKFYLLRQQEKGAAA